ncbi:MAG: methylmalonyl-CoA mutase [Vicingaceae bacterium]|jgi:methylmalonyl-CoA mutase
MEETSLFEEFETSSLSEWKEQIVKDLKGKDYEKTLVWKDENGIEHQPVYNAESIAKNDLITAIQAAQKKSTHWGNVQLFDAKDDNAVEMVTESLKNGLDFAFIENATNYKEFINSKPVGKQIYFFLDKIDISHLPKRFLIDPIKETLQGTAHAGHDMSALKNVFQVRLNDLKPDRFLLVDGSIYKESGATVVQELAYTLSHAVEYFDKMTEEGYTADAVARSFIFKLGYGNSYFTEIAKGRAFHYLVDQLYKQYKTKHRVVIWGDASKYYQSHKDAHTNLLRLSTQAMSAVLGNCNLVSLPAFDALEKSSSLGRRMSKNIPLILKEESSFEQVRDAANGSYYIEHLSADLAQKVWDLFLEVENQGGLLAYHNSGKLDEELNKSHQNRLLKYNSKERSFLGVNRFENSTAKDLKVAANSTNGIAAKVLSKDVNA